MKINKMNVARIVMFTKENRTRAFAVLENRNSFVVQEISSVKQIPIKTPRALWDVAADSSLEASLKVVSYLTERYDGSNFLIKNLAWGF